MKQNKCIKCGRRNFPPPASFLAVHHFKAPHICCLCWVGLSKFVRDAKKFLMPLGQLWKEVITLKIILAKPDSQKNK